MIEDHFKHLDTAYGKRFGKETLLRSGGECSETFRTFPECSPRLILEVFRSRKF
jgi:hypothetical protein